MQYLILDTNIYRELGPAFTNNIDFIYFRKFVERSPHEIIMLDIVLKEFNDYFKKDYLTPVIKEYEKVYIKFEKNPFLESIPLADLTILENNAKNKFNAAINASCWKILKGINISSELLADFLLYNKRVSTKDNTRDFLILLNILDFSNKNRKNKVVFITKDRIFTENNFFKKTIEISGVTNLEIIDSIAGYLSEYSAKISFIDVDDVLNSISVASLKKEIVKDVDCFPSYISSYYNDPKSEVPKHELIDIVNVRLKEYYTFSEDKIKTVIVTTLIVRVKIVYKNDDIVGLKNYPKKIYNPENLGHVDNLNRLIYDNDVLFIFEGLIDKSKKKITKQRFIDFIPDWNVPD
jgi:PIN domain